MNDYPSSEISGMRFRRPPVAGLINIRQLDTNDLLDIEHPETDIGALVQEVLTSLFDETYRGAQGYSAYELAVQEGFVGTIDDWIESLEGTSAYGVAVENGFVGTEEDWIADLQGEQGDQGIQGIQGIQGATGPTLVPFTLGGDAYVADWPFRWYAFADGTLAEVRLSAGGAPTGSALVLTIKKNGVLAVTMTLPAGENTVLATPAVSILDGDYLTVQVTGVGSTFPGSDITLQLKVD